MARKGELTRGQRNIAWIHAHIRVPEGKDVGKPLKLRKWQQRKVVEIYDNPHKTRRAIISYGRKNAKTAFAAILLLLHLVGPEARPNSQLNSAAQSRDQASVLFALAAKMVRMSADLSYYVTIRDTRKELFCSELGTLYRALSADAATAYGLSPVFAVHDELGQVRGPRSDLYEAIETAAGAHEDPLTIIISTQAPTDADLLSLLIDDAATGHDPRVKLFLYTAPMDIDPFSEKAIKAANPAYGDFLNATEVRNQAETARRMPSAEAAYRNLILNQRVNQVNPLIARAVWEACSGKPDPEVLKRCRVWVALDLSARNDMTALCMVAVDENGVYHVWVEYFAPTTGLRERCKRDRVPYDVWAAAGLITLTPGASVEYGFVCVRLIEISNECQLEGIVYDRWRIDILKAELARMGVELPMKEWGQGFKDMSPAIDALESALLNVKIRHGNNPVLNWNAANAISVRDPAGNRKLDKSKTTGRIDGLQTVAMAIGAIDAAEESGGIPDGYLPAFA